MCVDCCFVKRFLLGLFSEREFRMVCIWNGEPKRFVFAATISDSLFSFALLERFRLVKNYLDSILLPEVDRITLLTSGEPWPYECCID